MPSTPALAASGSSKPRLSALIEREQKRKRRARSFAAIASATSVMIAVAIGAWLRPRPTPLAERYRAQAVTRGDVLREVNATGHLEALTTVEVGAEISGRIATVEVDYNAQVRSGQVLARFDRTSLQAQLTQASAQRATAAASVAQARADGQRAASNAERAERLMRTQSVTAQALDESRTTAAIARERLRAAQAELAAREAALVLARTSLDHATIVAPIDGMVITRNVDPGQTVASVLQTPVLFTVAADLRAMRVLADVDEADIGEVALGQPASFTVHAYPERAFPARVIQVRNAPQTIQDVVTYTVELSVQNPDLALKPGMTASVHIRTDEAHAALRVPVAALSFTPPGHDASSGPGLWWLDGELLRHAAVHPGVADGELVALADGDIPLGTRVLVELTPQGRLAYGLAR